MSRVRSAKRVTSFADSVFGEMTRLAKLHNAVNLSQGFPDFEAPAAVKEAACAAIRDEQNQYAPPYGTKALREAIADDFTARHGVPVIADEQVTVCCGSTEAMMAVMMGCIDPGDEVIVFEPFYENYGPDAIMAGAQPKFVRLHAPDWTFDPDELKRAFSNRTRAIVINSPNNPTGKVFTRAELEIIASLCLQWDVLAISDEIYERIVFDGAAARADRVAAGHGRSDGDDERAVEDLQRHRLAHWLGDCAGVADRRHPQDPRLPDRRGAHAVHGRRRRRAVDAAASRTWRWPPTTRRSAT